MGNSYTLRFIDMEKTVREEATNNMIVMIEKTRHRMQHDMTQVTRFVCGRVCTRVASVCVREISMRASVIALSILRSSLPLRSSRISRDTCTPAHRVGNASSAPSSCRSPQELALATMHMHTRTHTAACGSGQHTCSVCRASRSLSIAWLVCLASSSRFASSTSSLSSISLTRCVNSTTASSAILQSQLLWARTHQNNFSSL
jgi:hypothetical protein